MARCESAKVRGAIRSFYPHFTHSILYLVNAQKNLARSLLLG